MTRPSIDHGILSPSGHVSRRSERLAKAEARRVLFPDGFPEPIRPMVSERESLLRNAAQLRELAARGMKPRAFIRQAEMLEARASATA
jgi:hypothetical protein